MDALSTEQEKKERWRRVYKSVMAEVRPVGRHWFNEHGNLFFQMTREELESMSKAMVKGPMSAQSAIVSRMSPEEYDAYVLGTTYSLAEVVRRRAAMLDALEDLGPKLLKAIGLAIMKVL